MSDEITPQQQALKERMRLDESGPYLFHRASSLETKLQIAQRAEESFDLVFGILPAARLMELAGQIILPLMRAKHEQPIGGSQTLTMDGDDRLLRVNVMLTLGRANLKNLI